MRSFNLSGFVTVLTSGIAISGELVIAVFHDNFHTAGEGHSLCLIIVPLSKTMLAVPVLNVTILYAGGFLSIYVNESVGCIGISVLVTYCTPCIARKSVGVIYSSFS